MEGKYKNYAFIILGVILAIYLVSSTLPDVSDDLENIDKASDTNNFVASNSTAVLFGDATSENCIAPLFYNSSTLVGSGNYTLSGVGTCYITLDDDRYNGETLTVNYTRETDIKGGMIIGLLMLIFLAGLLMLLAKVLELY